jgi:hypothetical protein
MTSSYEAKGGTRFALIVVLESAAAYFAIVTLHLVYTHTESANVIVVGGLVSISYFGRQRSAHHFQLPPFIGIKFSIIIIRVSLSFNQIEENKEANQI